MSWRPVRCWRRIERRSRGNNVGFRSVENTRSSGFVAVKFGCRSRASGIGVTKQELGNEGNFLPQPLVSTPCILPHISCHRGS